MEAVHAAPIRSESRLVSNATPPAPPSEGGEPEKSGVVRRVGRHFAHRLASVHRDQRGAISILSVFTLLVFTFLLVMIVNVAAHYDDKIKMQNSADAAAHSGAVVLARGMNALAFSNHLLCDVFAMTAYLREGRDRHAEKMAPQILDQWNKNAEKLSGTSIEKFKNLGNALKEKVAMERALVSAFGELSAAAAEYSLPVFEAILSEEQIPKFQYNVIHTIPELAQRTTSEVAIRNGLRRQDLASYPNVQPSRTNTRPNQAGVLWRMSVMPVGYPDENDPMSRTLPVVDPTPTGTDYNAVPDGSEYLNDAILQRKELAKHYLEWWTQDKLVMFDNDAELSQFGRLWRIFTCGQLDKLLNEEYPNKNLPIQIRRTRNGLDPVTMRRQGMQRDVNEYLNESFQFVTVVYRKHMTEHGPGLFRNPLSAEQDALAFAQVTLFVPPPRYRNISGGSPPTQQNRGGAPGFSTGAPIPPQTPPPGQQNNYQWGQENWPPHWNLLSQNWTVKLVPATAAAVPDILQQTPPNQSQSFNPPSLGGATIQHLNQINTH